MNTIFDFLCLRKPKFEYVCPPLCEFSASGFPIIVLNPFSKGKVTGLVLGGVGNFRLSWNAFPGALCYTIYRATTSDPFGPYTIVAECVNGNPECPTCPPGDDPHIDITPFGEGCYRVSAITEDGESDLSDPVCSPGTGGGQTVTVIATDPEAYEIGEVPGVFTIFRTGDTSNPVTVNFTVSGTAVPGVDYDPIGTTAFMAAGVTSVQVIVTPIDNLILGPDLTVILTLQAGDYFIGSPNAALITIHQSAADAPCSLFESDSTVYGTINLSGACPPEAIDGFVCQVTGLDIGSYRWEYVSGAYFSTPNWWVVRTTGCSGLGNQVGHQYFDGVSEVPGGLNYFDFVASLNENHATQAAAEAEYAAQVSSGAGSLFIREPAGIARLKTCIQTDPNFATFRIRRVLKLSQPQPLDLQIQNFSSYVLGRFTVTYNAVTSAPIALDASAATVQTALNAMATIVADGGVTCAGALSTGMTITWNVNGNRNLSAGALTTVNPGITAVVILTQDGTGILPEIQTLTVGKYCSDFNVNAVLPEYTGTINTRDLSFPQWYENPTPYNANLPPKRQSNIEWLDTRVQLVVGPEPPVTAPTVAAGAAGNVNAGAHKWKIVFVGAGGESSGSPESAELVLGVASQVNLTNIPIGPTGTTQRRVYRTLAGGTTYYQVDTIPNNTATIYTDNTDDASIFNAGFGTPIKPTSCFWVCAVVCVANVAAINFPAVIWSGAKLTGVDPVGEYLLSYPYGSIGGQQCPVVNQAAGGLSSITLTGIF